jgi:hypothetical protein
VEIGMEKDYKLILMLERNENGSNKSQFYSGGNEEKTEVW